ncbi:hypothetical protein K2X05_11885 [bacterium]|nr:hypothetical protein [bacterium]
MSIKTIFISIIACIAISSCGRGGGDAPGEPSAQVVLENDLKSLQSDQHLLQSLSNASNDSEQKFEQIFGFKKDPVGFVQKRLQFPFNDKDRAEILIVDKSGHYETVSLSSLTSNNKKSSTRLATNYGTHLWKISQKEQMELEIQTANKNMALNSPHIGLVGFTSRFFTNYVANSAPREARMSIYVHESRHSDCTGMEDGFSCGYGHIECPSGHDMAGLDACDRYAWGAYSVGAVYLNYVKHQFRESTRQYRYLNSLAIESLSRLSEQALEDLETETPELKSL